MKFVAQVDGVISTKFIAWSGSAKYITRDTDARQSFKNFDGIKIAIKGNQNSQN
jgi:hypothetical protein